MKSLIDHAIWWAEQGVPVFPCAGDKSPLTSNGFYDAVSSPKEVRALFEFYGKDAKMIGGRMGSASGLVAIDVDLYKPGGEAWYKARVDGGELSETRVHKTKSGGLHLIYEAENIASTVIADGVDVKGEGGYIILPGTPGYTVEQEGLRPIPEGLVEAIRLARKNNNLVGDSEHEAAILNGSSFHEPLTLLAARMASRGSPLPDIQSRLLGLMNASVAANTQHDRYARWASIMRGNELANICISAFRKFGAEQQLDNVLQDIPNEVMDDLELQMEQVFPHINPEQPDYVPVENEWPYAGYFAHEDLQIDDQNFVLYPILAESESVVMFAEPKTGKTALALTMGLNVACGFDWGEFQTPGPASVLYFALEGTRAIRLRVTAWKKMMQEEGHELPEVIPFRVVENAAGFYKDAQKIDHAKRIIQHNKMCEKEFGLPVKVIVIDTLTKAMTGGDQNSAEDTAALFEIVAMLRSSGITATVIFVHHKARAGGNVRGSSNIEAEPDVLLDVSKDNDFVVMKVARARSIEDGGVYNFKLRGIELGKNKQGFMQEGVVPEWVERTEDATDFLLALLAMDEGSKTYYPKDILPLMIEYGLVDDGVVKVTKEVTDKLVKALGGEVVNHGNANVAVERNPSNKLFKTLKVSLLA